MLQALDRNEPQASRHRLNRCLPGALAWVLANPVLSVALVGARTPAEVEDNMAALDVEFDSDSLLTIDSVFDRYEVDTSPDVWVE